MIAGFVQEWEFREATKGRYDALAAEEAALALRLRLKGFAFFRTGGRPKLEHRSEDGWVTELLVRVVDGTAWVEYQYWSKAVGDLRRRYCKDRHPPLEILSGNIGRWLTPPIWAAWGVDDLNALGRVATSAQYLNRLLASPDALRRGLSEGALPSLNRDRCLELIYLKAGAGAAKEYLATLRRADVQLDRELERNPMDYDGILMGPYAAYSPELRLTAMARACRLI